MELGQAWGLDPRSLSLTFIHGPCQLQAPVFAFQSLPCIPSGGAAVGLGGRTQAGQCRLGVGVQLKSSRFKIVK